MVYPNLEAEMARHGYTREDIASKLEIHVSGVYLMLSGKRNISLTRAAQIRDAFFPDMRIDYLFDTQNEGRGDADEAKTWNS